VEAGECRTSGARESLGRFGLPALTDRPNLCRASGAGLGAGRRFVKALRAGALGALPAPAGNSRAWGQRRVAPPALGGFLFCVPGPYGPGYPMPPLRGWCGGCATVRGGASRWKVWCNASANSQPDKPRQISRVNRAQCRSQAESTPDKPFSELGTPIHLQIHNIALQIFQEKELLAGWCGGRDFGAGHYDKPFRGGAYVMEGVAGDQT
jgi:hypothetical protein